MENKTSGFSNGLLWFGAAVSMAEILTGTFIAPLGMTKGIMAIITGHVIGVVILYLAGLIGAKSKVAAIESSRISFGKYGSFLFSILNILQLIGWTAVMIIVAAQALNQVSITMFSYSNEAVWSIVIGALIAAWIGLGIKKLEKVNIFAIGALFVLTVILSFVVFRPSETTAIQEAMTFGQAVELSAVMAISWLPLIADYTRFAKNEKQATFASAIGYFIGSCWMYIIGLSAAIYLGTTDITQILLASGLGVVALLIVIMSTVTTTFLDVYSAGVSITNISKKVDEKWAAIVICLLGTLLAIFTPIQQYESFLYMIGSVFAPMFAILLTDYFIFKKRSLSDMIHIPNLVLWAVGILLYYLVFLKLDTPIGSTLPVMVLISLLCILFDWGKRICLKK